MWAACVSRGKQLGEGFYFFTDFSAGVSPGDIGGPVKTHRELMVLAWELWRNPHSLKEKSKRLISAEEGQEVQGLW